MKQTDLYNKHFSKTNKKIIIKKPKQNKEKSCSEMDNNLPYLKPATQALPPANRKILLS